MSPTAKGNIVKAKDEVLGVKVMNNQDESLGKVYEIMLDKLSGQVVYVVLDCGSFLGIGGKLFAIPWQAISYDPDKDSFILDIDKDRLQNAPGFDNDAWPNMADEDFGNTISQYYGEKSTTGAGSTTGASSSSTDEGSSSDEKTHAHGECHHTHEKSH